MKLRKAARGLLGLAALASLFACQGKPPAAPAGAAEESAADKDRRELVLQPKQAGAPEDAARKLSIQLIPERSDLALGGKYRYRLETRNVGREAIAFRESAPSFIKDGSLCAPADFVFYVTPPDGAEQAVPCGPAPAAGSALDLTLKPGEYLLTRPESPANRFRELRTPFRFDRLGTYRIKVVYDAGGLKAESNPVVFKVEKPKKPVAPHAAAAPKPVNSSPR